MPNQNIKKEIKKHLYMILNLAGVKKSIADKVVPIGVERIIDDVVREAFERFIEETRIEEDKTDYRDTTGNTEEEGRLNYEINEAGRQGYNEAIGEIRQAQAKWLKENL